MVRTCLRGERERERLKCTFIKLQESQVFEVDRTALGLGRAWVPRSAVAVLVSTSVLRLLH